MKPVTRSKGTIALLAFAGLVVAVVVLQPWWLALLVGHWLASASGRSVHFDSLWIGLSSGFEPVVHARGVRIENAAWADTRRPFAALDELVAVVSWRSVAEHRPVLALMVLRDGAVDLERQADGLRNWRLHKPDDRGPGRIKVLSLRGERATLRFAHRGIDLDLQASARPNEPGEAPSAAGEVLPIRLDLKGAWHELAFHASIATGETLTFLETGRTFPLRGRLEAGGARLEVDGRAGDIVRAPSIDAHVALAGSTPAPFHAFIGPRYRSAKAVRVEGRLKAADHVYALSSLQARVGATDFAGDAAYTHGESRNAVRMSLTSATADLADLLWLAGVDPEHRRAGPADGTFDLRRAREFDVDLTFQARRLRAASFPLLQSLTMQAAWADGLLTLSALDLGLAEGHATGRATFDLRAEPASAEGDLALHGVLVEALWPEQGEAKRVTGVLQGRARLKTAGASTAALLASASGSVTAALTGGTISSLLDAELGLQGGKILRSMISGAEPIAIRCAAAALDLRRGRGQVRTLVIDTERTRTTGTGTIDLPDRVIDLVLTPEAKQRGLFVLNRSIRLHGPLLKPEHSLVDRAAATPGAPCAA